MKERVKNFDGYEKWFLKLRNNEYFGRLGKVFQTEENFYFLDTGTGKVAKVKENVYIVLRCLLREDRFETLYDLKLEKDDILAALEEIEEAVKKENILLAPILQQMQDEDTYSLERAVTTNMKSITLELTEKCNLRCKYCIYHPSHPNYREFGKENMKFEIAKKAVDLLQKNSINEKDVYIGFYGGEPLLNFEVLKSTIEYANQILRGKNIHYNVTTNGTLVTKEVAKFLVQNHVIVTFSLDGPQEIHDENRIFVDGIGSFAATIKGIETFASSARTFNEEARFTINMVISGPNYIEKYKKIDRFLKGLDWYSENIIVRCSGVDSGPEKGECILPHSTEELEIFKDMKEWLAQWSDGKIETSDEEVFSESSLNEELLKIHKRQLIDKPTQQYSMNGCCVPGQRRTYVSIQGELFPCERIGNNIPNIGDVNGGFDVSNIKKYYMDDFIVESKKICKNCWATNLCGLCYANCYDEKGMNIEYKNTLCLYERFGLEKSLSRYYRILENNPKKIEFFDDVEIL